MAKRKVLRRRPAYRTAKLPETKPQAFEDRWITGALLNDVSSIRWIKGFLNERYFDVHRIGTINIDVGDWHHTQLSYRVTRPRRATRGTLHVSVQKSCWPGQVAMWESPIYPKADGSWPKVAPGVIVAKPASDKKTGRTWCRCWRYIDLKDGEEAVVYEFGQAAFTLLRYLGEIKGRRHNAQVSRFAYEFLTEYREWINHSADSTDMQHRIETFLQKWNIAELFRMG